MRNNNILNNRRNKSFSYSKNKHHKRNLDEIVMPENQNKYATIDVI